MNEQNADIRSNEEGTAPEVPDFDLIRPVGSGGFGEVWLATNRTTGLFRAIKIIPLHTTGCANLAAREIGSITRLEANSRCRHPNLLPIHHVGKTARHLFYVMDPADDVSGSPASDKPEYRPATLQEKLQSSPLTPDDCLQLAQQLLAGLAMLHAAGMVHRDVKPANCLFVGGQLKLADFGLLTEAHPLVSRVGTQRYMPPDGRMDMRADVYAAGLVIYEMLSGLPVDEFPRLGPQSQNISDNPILTNLLQLVLRACEREAEKRPADARAMLAELTTPVRPTRRALRRVTIAACAAILLAATGLGAWMLHEPRTTAAPGEAAAPNSPQRVSINFVTYPFEAKVYLDDELQRDADGKPYTTPCTIADLPARTCTVWFQYGKEPRWKGGEYDLGKTQQIVGKLPQ